MKKTTSSPEFWHKRFTQQAQWTTSIRNYLFKKTLIMPNSRILEVGCGTCAIISQFVETSTHAYGLDLDRNFLHYGAKRYGGLKLTQGDGHKLPYASNTFDVIFCHYLLLWVDQPDIVLREFARVGKSRSKLIIFAEPDYGGRIDSPPPLEKLGRAQTDSLKSQGADPFIGRSLTKIAHSINNINIIESGVLGSQSVAIPDDKFVESEREMITNDLLGIMDKDEINHLLAIDSQAWHMGIRVLFVPTFYLIAEKY